MVMGVVPGLVKIALQEKSGNTPGSPRHSFTRRRRPAYLTSLQSVENGRSLLCFLESGGSLEFLNSLESRVPKIDDF